MKKHLSLLALAALGSFAQPYNGTINGTPTSGAAKFSTGYSGWSSANYIAIPAGAGQVPSSTSMAVSAWFKTSVTGWQFVFGNNTSASTTTITLWGGYGSDGPRCQIGNGTPGSTTAVNDNLWHHIHCDLSGTTVRTFVDGTQVNSYTTSFTPPSGTAFRVGVNPAGGDVVSGQIDELAIWNASKHTSTFTPPTAAFGGSESDLRALYHFDGNATDSAGSTGPLTAGTLEGALGLSLGAASGGTSPYSYQLQSYSGVCASGTFANDGAALTSQTSSALFARADGTTKCYRVVVTDAASATANSNQVTAPTGGGVRSY